MVSTFENKSRITMSMLRHQFAVLAALVTMAVPGTAKAETLLVNNFGARGDGIAVDTASIQKALDQGAGKHATIPFKPGTYLIGSIFVKSGETLEIPGGVKLIGIQ